MTSMFPEMDMCTCGHEAETHDVISVRYCAATVMGALDRGCVCVSGPQVRE
jgi:hypothetical protein